LQERAKNHALRKGNQADHPCSPASKPMSFKTFISKV
jgi:hypothetical protein